MSGACWRFSWFISISYSKSEIARSPLTIARRADLARELDDEDVERLDAHVAEVLGGRLLDERDPLLDRRTACVPLRIGQVDDRDDDLVEQLRGAR